MADKDSYQADIFANRIAKRFRFLRKWARKERISCYRLYNRDIPEIPLAVDLYEFLPPDITDTAGATAFINEEYERTAENDPVTAAEKNGRRWLRFFLYERPYEKPEAEEAAWLDIMARVAAEVVGISPDRVIIKTRKHDKGGSQYRKQLTVRPVSGIVHEQELMFRVDLSSYLDTGLFLDHRPLRSVIRKTSRGKSVLNLYCYTAAFSVCAARGNARYIESVDLSNTYLAWAEKNMKLNGFTDKNRYVFTRADVSNFLTDTTAAWDIIILDPPTFSNSKKTDTTLDINRDWSILVNRCVHLLVPGGILYFSTNSSRFRFEAGQLEQPATGPAIKPVEITETTIPDDFRGSRTHRCWKIEYPTDATASLSCPGARI